MTEERKAKTCFVIMPITDDVIGYEPGHFGRVYEYIIKPAVIKAGFVPKRADEVQKSNYIMIDILQSIVNSDMCICDLSSRNPNVMYELGIRQAFNLPVTLMKDRKTQRVFDIQGFRDIEYEENLRIDNVELAKESLTETIINTHESAEDDVNSIIQLLGVSPAKITNETKLSDETSILLKAIEDINRKITEQNLIDFTKKKRIVELPNILEGQTVLFYQLSGGKGSASVGNKIKHAKFGIGEITCLYSDGVAEIQFEECGKKRLMLDMCNLEWIVDSQ